VQTYEPDSPPLDPAYELKGPEDNTLIFESRFESGNLQRAYKLQVFVQRRMSAALPSYTQNPPSFPRSQSLSPFVSHRDDTSYDLVLSKDLYTRRHTQWFYFRVQNTRKVRRDQSAFLIPFCCCSG
jgi:hypothetical protein